MSHRAAVALLTVLAACSADLPPAQQHHYLVQYKEALNGADSAIIGYMGGTIELAIPMAKALVFRSTLSLAEVRSIPDKLTVDTVSSPQQVVNAVVSFKAVPTAYDLSFVMSFATPGHVSGLNEYSPRRLETGFKLSLLNELGRLYNVGGVDLDYPGGSQATVRR